MLELDKRLQLESLAPKLEDDEAIGLTIGGKLHLVLKQRRITLLMLSSQTCKTRSFLLVLHCQDLPKWFDSWLQIRL